MSCHDHDHKKCKIEAEYFTNKLQEFKEKNEIHARLTPEKQYELFERIAEDNKDILVYLEIIMDSLANEFKRMTMSMMLLNSSDPISDLLKSLKSKLKENDNDNDKEH